MLSSSKRPVLHIKWANTRQFSNSASILVPIHVSYNVSRLKTIRVRAVSETVRAHSRGFAEARTMLSRRTQKFLERSRRCEAAIRRKRQDRKQVL